MKRVIATGTGRGAGANGRWAACLVVLALLMQLMLPPSVVQAGGIDQALASSICHSAEDSGSSAPDAALHDHCSFCRIHLEAKLLSPPAAAAVSPSRQVLGAAVVPAGAEGISPVSLQSPQSRRGPPAVS